MTTPGIGHNSPPKDRTFKRRWAAAIFACTDRGKPAGAVAMAFRLYHDMDSDGRGKAISNLDLAAACGASERSVRTFKGWLVAAGFVRVLARGGRGGDTEYQAIIPSDIQPADFAGEIVDDADVQPAPITGNSEFNRHPLPAIDKIKPAECDIQPAKSACEAGQIENLPCAHTRAEVSNIYNNYNNLPTITHSPSEQDAAREGEEAVGFGVFVNCETIRHKAFTINLRGIECQLVGTVPLEEIKQVALGHALQWATDIADGKTNVVPKSTASFIRQSIQNQRTKSAHLDYRPTDGRRSAKQVPRPAGKSFAQLNDEILREIEREKGR